MKEFDFDLQLFAEDGGDIGAGSEETAVETSATEPAENTETDEPAQSKPDLALKIDPDTGRKYLVGSEEINQPQEEKPAQQEPDKYNSNELIKDFAMGRVDQSRIPQELEGYYEAIKQQRANEITRQQLQAQQAQIQQAQQAQQQPQQPVDTSADNVKMYAQMKDFATQKAMKDLGINGEEGLNDLQYSDDENDVKKYEAFNAAVSYNMQLIANAVAENQQQAAAARQSSMQEANAIVQGLDEYRKQEPNFNDIDVMMGTFYQTMPFEQARPIVQALNRTVEVFQGKPGAILQPGDKEILNNYYQATRKAYYEKKTGVGTVPQPAHSAPPRVEQTGQGNSREPAAKPDWKSMRGMSPRERREFLMKNL